MNSFAATIRFKDIIPNYDSFLDFIEKYTSVARGDFINAYLYKYLNNRYANSNIRYETAEAFLSNFGITYEDNFDGMKMRQRVCTELYNLSPNDLAIIGESVQSIALNDNSTNIDPLTVATFSSEQTATREISSRYIAYLDALEKMTNKYLEEFIYTFAKHFSRVICSRDYYYEKEEDDE